MITNPRARQWIYIAQSALGLVLLVVVALGAMDQDTSTQVEMGVGAVVLMLTGELARRNVAPAPKIDTSRIVDALAEQAQRTAATVGSSVDEARRDLEARLGRHRES